MTRRTLTAATVLLLLPMAAPAAAGTVVLPACAAVAAHKAGGTYAPENTLDGITASAQQGASVVEMDVRFLSAHMPILMHDPTVDRTTNGTGQVAGLSFGYATGLHAADYTPWAGTPQYSTTRVPYAYDFLARAMQNNLTPLLDVKTTPVKADADKLVEYLDKTGFRSRAVYMGSPASVQAMRGWYPGLTYALIEYPPAGMIRTGESLQSHGAAAYAVPWDRITPAAVAYWHSYGLDVYTWTSDRPEWDVAATWSAVTAAGADVIITDRPAALKVWQNTGCGGTP